MVRFNGMKDSNMFKKLMVLFCLLVPTFSFADFRGGTNCSGDVAVPIAGTVLADTGALSTSATTAAYFSINIQATSSVAGNMEVGIYNTSNVKVSSFRLSLPISQTIAITLPFYSIPEGYRMKITVPTLIALSSMNACISWSVISNY